jgi:hypothetical protein
MQSTLTVYQYVVLRQLNRRLVGVQGIPDRNGVLLEIRFSILLGHKDTSLKTEEGLVIFLYLPALHMKQYHSGERTK